MERLKDFLYYIGDFVICILILSAMYFLITWKLEKTIPIDAEGADKIALEVQTEDGKDKEGQKSVLEDGVGHDKGKDDRQNAGNQTDAKNTAGKQDAASGQNGGVNPNGEAKDKPQGAAGEQTDQKDPAQQADPKEKKPEDKKTKTPKKEKLVFSVSAGMTAGDIAQQLQDKAVIDNAENFLIKLEQMGLSASLLAGDFNLETGMDHETVIKILTGQL